MPYTLNLITTSPEYTEANTLYCDSSNVVRANIKVFNNGIYAALGTTPGLPQGAQLGQEVFYPPGMYSLDRTFASLAVRSAVPTLPAVVSIDAWRREELSNA